MRPETIVVGAGIVGLMTTYRLHNEGFPVAVVDARPNPFESNHWSQLGTTYGSMNARQVATAEHTSKARAECATSFLSPTTAGGFLVRPFEQLADDEKAWINGFSWMHGVDGLTRLSEDQILVDLLDREIRADNHAGKRLWRKLMADDPAIFAGTNLQEGVPIFYTSKDGLQKAISAEKVWGKVTVLTREDVAHSFPRLTELIGAGRLLTGGFQVDSFAIGIHKFCQNLISRLEKDGVTFTWNAPVTEIKKDGNDEVVGLYVNDGSLLEATNYMFCPGTFITEALRDTQAWKEVMGVVGFWTNLPGLDGLARAFKLDTAHLNVTPHERGTYASGGFVFIGRQHRVNLTDPGIQAGLKDFQQVVSQVFPGYPQTDIQACIRPMTPSGVAIWEEIPTSRGGYLVISTGQGAGGTTQAPSVAERAHSLFSHSSVTESAQDQYPLPVYYSLGIFSDARYEEKQGMETNSRVQAPKLSQF